MEKCENVRKPKFKGGWERVMTKILFAQTIWTKYLKQNREIGQGKKSFISAFPCFLTAIAKFNYLNGDWVLGYVLTRIGGFYNIS